MYFSEHFSLILKLMGDFKVSCFRALFNLIVKLTPLQQKAFNFYKKNCQSIEVVKDDELQKANFRVKSKVCYTLVYETEGICI